MTCPEQVAETADRAASAMKDLFTLQDKRATQCVVWNCPFQFVNGGWIDDETPSQVYKNFVFFFFFDRVRLRWRQRLVL